MSHVSDPAGSAVAVVPADATVLEPTRSLYIGGTGALAVRMYPGGETVTFVAVPVGILPVRVDKVLSTGTVATNILALR